MEDGCILAFYDERDAKVPTIIPDTFALIKDHQKDQGQQILLLRSIDFKELNIFPYMNPHEVYKLLKKDYPPFGITS